VGNIIQEGMSLHTGCDVWPNRAFRNRSTMTDCRLKHPEGAFQPLLMGRGE
jgi:hypothetical protein